MIICPKCGKIADYNYYFRSYFCNECNWKGSEIVQSRTNFSLKSHYTLSNNKQEKKEAINFAHV